MGRFHEELRLAQRVVRNSPQRSACRISSVVGVGVLRRRWGILSDCLARQLQATLSRTKWWIVLDSQQRWRRRRRHRLRQAGDGALPLEAGPTEQRDGQRRSSGRRQLRLGTCWIGVIINGGQWSSNVLEVAV